MPSYKQIEKQIADIGISTNFLPSTELKALPDVLHDGECIKGIARGLYKNRSGILVATTDRVIFFYKGRMWGERVEEFRYEKITSVEYNTGLIGGKITIYAAGNATQISSVPNAFCQPFAEAVREIINSRQTLPAANAPDEFLSKLERLAALKTAGMLSEEEFALAKAKLLTL